MFLARRGLLRARSRFPEIVENAESVTEGMKSLDGAVMLAKQMLSQLSYTPTGGFILGQVCRLGQEMPQACVLLMKEE